MNMDSWAPPLFFGVMKLDIFIFYVASMYFEFLNGFLLCFHGLISDCRCLVMWSNLVCDAGGIISFWRSRQSKGFPEDNSGWSDIKLFASFLYEPLIVWAQRVLVGSLQRVLTVQYSIPNFVQISPECRDLISRIFVFDPAEVFTIF